MRIIVALVVAIAANAFVYWFLEQRPKGDVAPAPIDSQDIVVLKVKP